MTKKLCRTCDAVKPLDDFYIHRQMADGHLNRCKECVKIRVKVHRARNLEHIRAYDRERGNRQTKEYHRKYIATKQKANWARNALSNAVRDKKIFKPVSCETCKEIKRLYGHHKDYERPLDVVWLCVSCHRRWHVKNGESLNARGPK